MQDFSGQLADFNTWLESVERPLEALHRQTEDKVAREDRDKVRLWLQQLQVSCVLWYDMKCIKWLLVWFKSVRKC